MGDIPRRWKSSFDLAHAGLCHLCQRISFPQCLKGFGLGSGARSQRPSAAARKIWLTHRRSDLDQPRDSPRYPEVEPAVSGCWESSIVLNSTLTFVKEVDQKLPVILTLLP